MRKNPSYTALLRPTRLLIFEKSATYMIKWSYTIIWQVTVHQIVPMIMNSPLNHLVCIWHRSEP